MNKFLLEDKNIVSVGAKKCFAPTTDLPVGELRKIVRRVVKRVSVPADLEMKAWNLLKKQL